MLPEELETDQKEGHEPNHHEDAVPPRLCISYENSSKALLQHGLEAQLPRHAAKLLGLLLDAVRLSKERKDNTYTI